MTNNNSYRKKYLIKYICMRFYENDFHENFSFEEN